jgi:salicylate hydroxylase
MHGENRPKNGNGVSLLPPSAQPLKILIVGAGIGGLFAAISLRQAGHQVSIYESSRFAVETGAAIHLPPNINGLLRRIGMVPEEHGAVTCESVRTWKMNGEGVMRRDLGGLKHAFAYPWQLCHRIDLHNSLKEIAMREQGKGVPVVIHLQSRVVEVNVEEVSITLQEGQKIQGDLLIGADGVHVSLSLPNIE